MTDLASLVPSAATIAEAFDVHEQHIEIAATVSRNSKSFLVSVNHPERPSIFEVVALAGQPDVERVHCPVTGLDVVHCNPPDPLMPRCRGCRLAK